METLQNYIECHRDASRNGLPAWLSRRQEEIRPAGYLRYGKEIADFLGISERTFYRYQHCVPLKGKFFSTAEIDQWRQQLNAHFAKHGRRRKPDASAPAARNDHTTKS